MGASNISLQRLHSEKELTKIDFLFLDHYKPAYLPDLKLCEQLGLVQPDTVLAADNVIKPGNPPYLEYVRSTVKIKREATTSKDALAEFDDTYARQYEEREGVEKLSNSVRGDPNLVYQSKLVRSFEPTGIPVCPHDHKDIILADVQNRMVLKLQGVLARICRQTENPPMRSTQSRLLRRPSDNDQLLPSETFYSHVA